MHLDEEQLQRVVDEEIASAGDDVVQRHLEQCAYCQRELASAAGRSRQINDLLRTLDHAPPSTSAADLFARVRPPHRWWLSKVAAVLLIVGAAGGIAWAAPGSPLRPIFRGVFSVLRSTPPIATPAAPEPALPAMSGLSVTPGARFTVHFMSATDGSIARIILTDGRDIIVRGPVGAATFAAHEQSLEISNRAPNTTFELEIPRSAPHVEVQVQGRRIYLLEREAITASVGPGLDGSYKIPLGVSTPK